MDNKTKQVLINQLSKISATRQPASIRGKANRSLVILLSGEDREKFEARRKEKLDQLKKEMNDILTAIRGCTKYSSLEEVELELAAHRQKIKREME